MKKAPSDRTSGALDALMACPDCDLLLRRPSLAIGEKARCPRCRAALDRGLRDPLDRTLALMLTALVLLIVANVYPLMTFSLDGRVEENTITSGVIDLAQGGFLPLAALIFFASIGAPLVKITGYLYVLVPLKLGRQPWRLAHSYRVLEWLEPWAMMEVYMLGLLVAISKLSQMATITMGIAFWAFVALIVISTAASATMDPQLIWKRVEAAQ